MVTSGTNSWVLGMIDGNGMGEESHTEQQQSIAHAR